MVRTERLCRTVPAACGPGGGSAQATLQRAARPPEPAKSPLSNGICVVLFCFALGCGLWSLPRPIIRYHALPLLLPAAHPPPRPLRPKSQLSRRCRAQGSRSAIRDRALLVATAAGGAPGGAGAGAGWSPRPPPAVRAACPSPEPSTRAQPPTANHEQPQCGTVVFILALNPYHVRALVTPAHTLTHLGAAGPGSPPWPCWSPTAPCRTPPRTEQSYLGHRPCC